MTILVELETSLTCYMWCNVRMRMQELQALPSAFEDMLHPDDMNLYLQSRCKQLQGDI